MSMKRDSGKSIAMTVAVGVVTFGLQQISSGEHLVGGLGIVIGLILFFGYQFAESNDHGKAYDDIVEAIGEDNFKELADMSAQEIRELRNNTDQ